MPLVFVRTCFSIHLSQASRNINTAVSLPASPLPSGTQAQPLVSGRGLSREQHPFFPPDNASTVKSLSAQVPQFPRRVRVHHDIDRSPASTHLDSDSEPVCVCACLRPVNCT